eukprot:14058443-Ditylum_brightwellii.AAC.1
MTDLKPFLQIKNFIVVEEPFLQYAETAAKIDIGNDASWRDVTARGYPDNNELLELIPKPQVLCVSRLANGVYLMTDTFITEQLSKTKFVETIQQITKEKGMNEDDIKVYIGNCWKHLQDIWIGAVVEDLCSQLSKDLKDDLDDFHFMLQVQTEVGQIYRAVEKAIANTSQALGGAIQDLGSEGAIPVLMNIPYYLEFLNKRLCCRSDNILMKNMYIMFQLVEVVALLYVLSIYHILITIPVRWLADNTDALADFDFGLADMYTT